MPFIHLLLAFLAAFSLTAAYRGSMTYYTPGLGSCGAYSSSSDAVVALSISMMGNPSNPNANPKCFSRIRIHNPTTGGTHWATIVDTCYACAHEDIDVSESLFAQVAPGGNGRVEGIEWG